jgi:adenosine deaminase
VPTPITLESVRSAPKVLLHDHLDGGLRPTTVIELADECGWTDRLPATDAGELQAWFTRGAETKDILQYLATFEHTVAVLQTEPALARAAREAVEDLAADGVVYAEIRFAPELHTALTPQAAVEAVVDGLERGERDVLAAGRFITVNLIVCAMRTEARSLEIATLVERMRFRAPKVVAFDLAGAETGFPPSRHAEALAFAREHHLNITIHASEPPDLELISDALAHGAHRIGHGVRLVKDMLLTPNGQAIFGDLARYVYDHEIPLELAPTCNVQIGAVPSIADHPIGPFVRLGFAATINTDNRLMSSVSPSSEHLAVASAFGWTWDDVERAVTNAAMAAFAPLEDRQRLVREVIRPAYASLR